MIRTLVLCLVLTSAMWPGQSAALDASHLQALNHTEYHHWDSPTLKRPFHIYVRTPQDMEAGQTYPVVYLLDGGASFPLLSGQYHYLRYTEEIPKLILVGISYGSDTFEGGNYRGSDFTAPSAEREHYGGASAFQKALRDELLPMIEARYPAARNQRILLGQSLGGQFVLFNALTAPQLFQGLIASNPALHRNLEFFMQWQGDNDAPEASTHLFVAAAEFDAPRFKAPAEKWISHWSMAKPRPFILEVQELQGHTHVSPVAEAFRLGIQWLQQQGVIR